MDDASICAAILKMQKPPLARRCIDKRALMRAVDNRFALRENYLFLVGAVNILRAQYKLPARGNAARRGRNVIEAVQLMKLWPFDCRVRVMAVEHHNTVIQTPRSV